jgi:hypothetical protein
MGTTSHLINKLSVSLLRLLPPKKIGLSYFSSGWALHVIELGDILPYHRHDSLVAWTLAVVHSAS